MKEKILAIRKALSKNFNSAPVVYLDGEDCHKFDLELPRVTHRIRFSLDVVDRYDATNFKRLCKGVAVFLKRKPTGKPRQVLLTNTGVVEEEFVPENVDEQQAVPPDE